MTPLMLIAIVFLVVCRSADPEPCNLGQHLGAVVDQVRQVAGDLVELPGVVGDGDTDVMRAVAGIGVPPAASRIEMQLGLSSRPSLPDCHGNIAPE